MSGSAEQPAKKKARTDDSLNDMNDEPPVGVHHNIPVMTARHLICASIPV